MQEVINNENKNIIFLEGTGSTRSRNGGNFISYILGKQKETSTLKLNKLVDMVLNGLVSEELYATKKQEITNELNAVKTEIEIYEKANDDFKEVLINAFYLASKP